MASKLCLCFAILLAYLEGSYGKVVNFKNCGPANVLQTVDVNPCTQEPCPVKKGENASVTLTFTTSGASPTAITSKAYGIVFGAQVPYPLPKPDGCKGCNLTCPLQPGPHVYLNDILIPTDVPSLRLIVKWELVDQSNQQILCFEFPISVTN